MQSLKELTPASRAETLPGKRRQFGIVSEQTDNAANATESSKQESIREIFENDNGMIIVKKEHDIYYIRHNIIFAKAGDVFFMPRKVPHDFIISEETLVSKEELARIDASLKIF